jgi:hypothetical protein
MTNSDHSKPSLFRRLWAVVLLTCLLITMPVALVLLLSGPVYKRTSDGYVPISRVAHRLYAGFLIVWVILATLRVLLLPGGFKQEWANSADPDLSPPASPRAASTQQPGRSDSNKASESSKPQAAQPPSDDQQQTQTEATLDVEVETEDTQYGPTLTLTAGEPFTLQRLVINGRDHEDNCDLPEKQLSAESTDTSNMGASMQSVYGAQLPKELKTGDKAVFFSGCGEVMKFDVYTNRGVFHFPSK